MKEGPDISRVASLIGDPTRAAMLLALMDRRALTATELSVETGVTKQTASGHLSRLEEGGLILADRQGRHRYFRIADDDVAHALEALMGVAERKAGRRVRPGPKDPALRRARICYDHLAGETGVMALDAMKRNGWIDTAGEGLSLTAPGQDAFTAFGVDLTIPKGSRRPLCRPCLDWSMRRHHLGGFAGKALLDHVLTVGLASREPDSRVIRFTPEGDRQFADWLGSTPPPQ